MTTEQIEAYANRRWNTTDARVVGYRISGNRTASAVIDGNGNHLSLDWHMGTGYTLPECPPMCACLDDLTDCPVPAENVTADRAQLWNEQRGA